MGQITLTSHAWDEYGGKRFLRGTIGANGSTLEVDVIPTSPVTPGVDRFEAKATFALTDSGLNHDVLGTCLVQVHVTPNPHQLTLSGELPRSVVSATAA